jgi:ribonuclease HII
MLELNFSKNPLESGTDEAGRGCLCRTCYSCRGNPSDFKNTILNDSNHPKAREKLRPIIEQQAITFVVTHLEP